MVAAAVVAVVLKVEASYMTIQVTRLRREGDIIVNRQVLAWRGGVSRRCESNGGGLNTQIGWQFGATV